MFTTNSKRFTKMRIQYVLFICFSKPGVETRMAQTFEIADGQICRIKLVFDTSAFT